MPERLSERFLIYGHRGSPKRFPENTLASFDEALRAGADGFETDLRLLTDRVAVLFHDDELDAEDIESLSSQQLRDRRGPLQIVSDLAPYTERTTMILEVKRSRWEDILVGEIANWRNIIVASFDHELIAALAQRNVGFPLGITTFGRIVGLADYAHRLGARWCFPSHQYVDADLVASLHEHGIHVVPWTANRERDWQRLHEAGCDGVITDLPEEAVAWRKGLGAP
jgi:glycerophosphoryl diester phosphodiesterase